MSNKSGTAPTRGDYPVIGIDPGGVFAYAIQRPGRPPTGGIMLPGQSWESFIDPHLPAYIFIEQPTGDDGYLRDQVWRAVTPILDELHPFDKDRQLVPCNVWRAEVLGRGDATKEDAIEWAKRHKRYRESGEGEGRCYSGDLAEAFAIAEYGRRLVEGRLTRAEAGLTIPRYDMAPGVKRKSSRSAKYRLDREHKDMPPLPAIPWRLIKSADPVLYAVMRVLASGYHAVLTHCEERDQRFTARAFREDARVSPNELPDCLAVLSKSGLVYEDEGCYVFRPASDPRAFDWQSKRERPFWRLLSLFLKPKAAYTLLRQWGDGGDPPLKPSHWAKADKRKRHDARWGKQPCDGCGTYAVREGEDYCDLCLEGQARWAKQEERQGRAEADAREKEVDAASAERRHKEAREEYERITADPDGYAHGGIELDALEDMERAALAAEGLGRGRRRSAGQGRRLPEREPP